VLARRKKEKGKRESLMVHRPHSRRDQLLKTARKKKKKKEQCYHVPGALSFRTGVDQGGGKKKRNKKEEGKYRDIQKGEKGPW